LVRQACSAARPAAPGIPIRSRTDWYVPLVISRATTKMGREAPPTIVLQSVMGVLPSIPVQS
jgi:hypothetical protein